MAAIRIYRRLQDLQDVDPNGLPQSGVPRYHTDVSSFVVETIAGGAGGSFSLGVSTIGNTLGDTGVTGSRVVLAGVGNLTLSQSTDGNGGTISISGGTAGAGGVALSASNSLFSSGTVVLSGVGGGATVNTAPGTIQISVAAPVAQSVQTQNRFNLTLDGNTAGALQEVSSGTLTLAGGNGITLSQNGNAVTISGSTFSQSVQPETQTFLGGVAASNTTYTSGTVTIVGSGIVTVQSGTGQRVIVNASQSAQTQDRFDLTISGNTAGAGALVSSGTLTLAGGNNITLSQAGNAITISGAAAAGAQTAISGIAASNTTYTSGTVTFSGVGGGVTVNSNTGQRVDISVAAQTGTQFSAGLTNSGNTSGDTGTVGGRLLLVGTNNITLSGSTNGQSMTITMSGPSVAGAQTGISGLANSQTTYTSGTVSLSELGAITIRSTTGQQFQFSVAAQTAESQSFGMSNIGNTSGTTGIASGAQVRFLLAGGNNISLSQSLNGASGTITISAFNQSNQSEGWYALGNTTGQSSSTTLDARTISVRGDGIVSVGYSAGSLRISASQSVQAETQTFIGGVANTETTYTSGTVKLLELGAITIRSTTGNQFQLSVNAQTGTQFSAGISGGNTSGDTGTVGGRLVLAGGNNITLSGSTNGASETITISAGAGGGFSAGVSNVGNTSGDTGITGSRLVLSGGQSITLSQSTNASGATVMISGASTSQSNQSLGWYAVQNTTGQSSSTTMDARTVSVAGDGAVSVGYSAGSLRISAPTQTVESQSIGMSNIGNTSGTTGIASGGQVRFLFAGGNNVTLSQSLNGASGTITISAFNQTGTQFSAGISGGNTSGDTGTVAGRVVFAGGNNVTLSGSTNGVSETITISAFNQTVESQSIGMSNVGNTSGTTGMASGGQVRFVFAGGNNITLSQSLNGASGTITISAPNLGAGAMSVGLSTMGNTAGSTGATGTRLILVASGNLSGSQSTDANGGTITFNDTVSAFQLGVSTDGNTAGATGVTGTRMVLVGSSPISLSQTTGANGGTVTINAPATSSLVGVSGISISTNGSTISVFPTPRTSFTPHDEVVTVTAQQGQGTLHLQPVHFPHVQYDRMLLSYQISNASNSSNSFTLSNWVGIYTKNVSTLSLVSSISTSTNFSGSGTVGSYTLYGGLRQLSMPWTMTLSDGDYWVGIVTRTTTGGGAGHTLNQIVKSAGATISSNVTAWSGLLGAATNATVQQLAGLGTYSVSTSGIPNTIGFSEITGTGTLPMNTPLFVFRSGTV